MGLILQIVYSRLIVYFACLLIIIFNPLLLLQFIIFIALQIYLFIYNCYYYYNYHYYYYFIYIYIYFCYYYFFFYHFVVNFITSSREMLVQNLGQRCWCKVLVVLEVGNRGTRKLCSSGVFIFSFKRILRLLWCFCY